jgi:hypothetical protein
VFPPILKTFFSGSESSPAIYSSNFMNRKMFLGRRHKATTNLMMATMAAVADNDGDGGRRRQR